jgi:hypothetical protein
VALTRWGRFVKAWEKRLGDEERSGFAVPRNELLVIRSAYNAWRKDERATGISATDWLEERAEEFERRGFRRRAKEGETRITSDWRYDVWTFDETGQWDRDGNNYAAIRSFTYDVGGPLGSGAGYTHVESCMHNHASPDEADPCLQEFVARGGPPSLDDLKPKEALLIAPGTYRDGYSGEQYQGDIEAWDFGLTVPNRRREPPPDT